MKKVLFIIITGVFAVIFVSFVLKKQTNKIVSENSRVWWNFQSIDTMKYSRDISREKLKDPSFALVIDEQIRNIKQTGATHVGIATPYDDEFLSILKLWVTKARKYKLNVWFRGNFSGWEGWFGYSRIDRVTHQEKIKNFILKNPEIFEDGDIFSGCPECENGGPGDPRTTGDIKGHQKFLIDEYSITKTAFRQIGKNVQSNFLSMNGDVAKLIMDKHTTSALDGIVAIDHYVPTPERLIMDIKSLASQSGGKIVLGEIGIPVPDINGNMNQDEQSQWLEKALSLLVVEEDVVGVNYWVNTGGSTGLWSENGEKRKGVDTLAAYFKPQIKRGIVVNELNSPIANAKIRYLNRSFMVDSHGQFVLSLLPVSKKIDVSADDYKSQNVSIDVEKQDITIVLKKDKESPFFSILKVIKKIW